MQKRTLYCLWFLSHEPELHRNGQRYVDCVTLTFDISVFSISHFSRKYFQQVIKIVRVSVNFPVMADQSVAI